jgi:hypothetical protein
VIFSQILYSFREIVAFFLCNELDISTPCTTRETLIDTFGRADGHTGTLIVVEWAYSFIVGSCSLEFYLFAYYLFYGYLQDVVYGFLADQ